MNNLNQSLPAIQFMRYCLQCSRMFKSVRHNSSLWFIRKTQPGYMAANQKVQNLPQTSRHQFCRKYCMTADYKEILQSVQDKRELSVKPFGQLKLGIPASILIKPIDPIKYPYMDRVIIGTSDDGDVSWIKNFTALDSNEAETTVEYIPDVDQNVEANRQNCSMSKSTTCVLSVPIKYGLDLEPGPGKDVAVMKMESDYIKIKNKAGKCFLNNVKASDITLESHGGLIVNNSVLQGNIKITTLGNVPITADKFQSIKLYIQQEEADLKIDALYGKTAKIKVNSGQIKLGSCHGDMFIDIAEHGDLCIGGMDGNLEVKVKKGDVDVVITQHEEVNIAVEQGDITISLMEGVQSDIFLEALEIEIDEQIPLRTQEKRGGRLNGHVGEDNTSEVDKLLRDTKKRIRASTQQGKVKLSVSNWFSSLKLG